MTNNIRPSDSIEFSVNLIEKEIADIVPQIKGAGKWRAFNAILHLNKAWKIKGIDNEMSAFRAITAEEEAATAVFLSLKLRKYENSDKLKPMDHSHKSAFATFVMSSGKTLISKTRGINSTYKLKKLHRILNEGHQSTG